MNGIEVALQKYSFPTGSGTLFGAFFSTENDVTALWKTIYSEWGHPKNEYEGWEKVAAFAPSVIPHPALIWWKGTGSRIPIRAVIAGPARFWLQHKNESAELLEELGESDIPQEYALALGGGDKAWVELLHENKWKCAATIDGPPLADTADVVADWNDLLAFGAATGQLRRQDAGASWTEIPEWSARLGWYIFLPFIKVDAWWNSLPAKKKVAAIIGLSALSAFWVLSWAIAVPEPLKQTDPTGVWAEQSTQRNEITELLDQAEQVLIFNDKDRALTLLKKAFVMLEDSRDSNLLVRAFALQDKAMENISDVSFEILRESKFAPVSFAIYNNSDAMIIIWDNGRFEWYDISKKEIIATGPLGGTPRLLSCENDPCLVITDSSIIRLNTKASRRGQIEKEWKLPNTWPQHVSKIAVRQNFIYAVSQQPSETWQIWKIPFTTTIGRPIAWHQAQEGIVRALRIDREITVWNFNRTRQKIFVETWLQGRKIKETPLLSGIDKYNARAVSGYPKPQYLLDAENKKIISIDEQGRLRFQLLNSRLSEALQIANSSQRVFIALKRGIHEVKWSK